MQSIASKSQGGDTSLTLELVECCCLAVPKFCYSRCHSKNSHPVEVQRAGDPQVPLLPKATLYTSLLFSCQSLSSFDRHLNSCFQTQFVQIMTDNHFPTVPSNGKVEQCPQVMQLFESVL
ncbi:hypothetical protein PRUPE_2G025600 [Prunus persica]|uniref:Uncharacterized protein n=1 Tax=Prunus persica TaxID=3760 RepID=M5X564_PRUPE|nr:hypothetical protein PRUPE_2G025600 [Prunus persica]